VPDAAPADSPHDDLLGSPLGAVDASLSPDVPGDHYFTAWPASADERRTLSVRLAGRDVTVETAGGVFSPGRLDLGTQVLLRSVPQPPATGDLLDLGCGWGPVALSLAMESPDARVWAVDVNERALDLVRRNAARLGLTGIRAVTPDAVPDDATFDAVWSNPPIRVGKDALHAMLLTWLPRLAPGAQAHLVVQRNLGADSLQRWLAEALGADDVAGHDAGQGPAHGPAGMLTVERAASAKGFRVLRVSRG